MKNKAQISAQIFTYIMAAIIIAGIALVGFKGISIILDKFKDAPLRQFESDLSRQVSSSSSNYMSKELFEFKLPSTYDEICFIDSVNIGSISTSKVEYTAIKNKIENKVEENVFLMKRGKLIESLYVKDMDVLEDFVCIENMGLLGVWFEGTGKYACLKLEQSESCQ